MEAMKYGLNDMVKAGCGDCRGCSACCRGMGDSIILNPYDIWLLTTGLGISFEGLMAEKTELNMVNGTILPNLKMVGREEACAFLNQEGRCSVHPFRPGLCRLFPLGRDYTGEEIRYFLLEDGCRKENRTKVKVQKWLDTENIKENEKFLMRWHRFLKEIRRRMEEEQDVFPAREVNLYILKHFYVTPYEKEDFYSQFYERLETAERELYHVV